MGKVCNFCGNKNLKETISQYVYKHNDNFLIVNDVPCIQCEYCGEQYFAGHVLKSIEEEFNRIYLHGKRARKELRIPVEQFLEIQTGI